jgi:hypothetical protein
LQKHSIKEPYKAFSAYNKTPYHQIAHNFAIIKNSPIPCKKTIFIFYLQIKQKNGERQTAFPQTFKPFLGGFYYFSLQKQSLPE